MGQTIGRDILPFAVGIAISPMPIIAIILMLITPKARTNGLAFLAGWILGLLVIGGSCWSSRTPQACRARRRIDDRGRVKLLLGLLLLFGAALRQWRSRPAAGRDRTDAQVDAGPRRVHALEVVRPGLPPLGDQPEEPDAEHRGDGRPSRRPGLSGGEQVVPTARVRADRKPQHRRPVGVYFTMGDRAGEILGGWKAWLAANNPAVMAVLLLVFGAVLIGQGISGLSSWRGAAGGPRSRLPPPRTPVISSRVCKSPSSANAANTRIT